jgi:hypothetical protein
MDLSGELFVETFGRRVGGPADVTGRHPRWRLVGTRRSACSLSKAASLPSKPRTSER